MTDRFDLEQEILECWRVTSDIKMFVDNGADNMEMHSLAIYYERKFEKLWNTFETMVGEKKFK